jgi:hypothetical protein
MGAFPPDFEPESVLQPPDAAAAAEPAGAGGLSAVALRAATDAALEGVLNRVRPLTAHRQPADRAPQPHGIHPLVVASPMVDEAQAHAAQRVIYASVTRGEGRGLWPRLAAGAPPAGGDAGDAAGAAAAAVLSAPQATEAAVLQALQLVIGGQQDYTNIFGGGSGGGPTGGGPPLPRITASGDGGDDGPPGMAGAGAGAGFAGAPQPSARVLPRAMSRRLANGLPPLPAAVRAELQVRRRGGLRAPLEGPACAAPPSANTFILQLTLPFTPPFPRAQNLLTQLQHMRVSMRLCPRAALTAEAPCGHFVRAWAVAAPCGPPPAGPGTLVSASGHVMSSSTHPLSSRLRASSIASSNMTAGARSLALPSAAAAASSGRFTSRLGATRSGALPLRVPRRSYAGDSAGGRSQRLSGSWRGAGGAANAPFSGLSPFVRQGSLQLTGANASAPLGARLRPHATELMRTTAANLSGALVTSSLFSGRAAAAAAAAEGSESGWDADWEADSGLGVEASSRLDSEDLPFILDGADPRPSADGGGGAGSSSAADGGASGRAGCGFAAPPPAGDGAIVASAYIDGTLAAGGVYGGDGQLLDASLAGARPAAAHGFDRVIGGAASTFQDVLEAEAEAAQAAYVVYVDENTPSVLEVRGGRGGRGLRMGWSLLVVPRMGWGTSGDCSCQAPQRLLITPCRRSCTAG